MHCTQSHMLFPHSVATALITFAALLSGVASHARGNCLHQAMIASTYAACMSRSVSALKLHRAHDHHCKQSSAKVEPCFSPHTTTFPYASDLQPQAEVTPFQATKPLYAVTTVNHKTCTLQHLAENAVAACNGLLFVETCKMCIVCAPAGWHLHSNLLCN